MAFHRYIPALALRRFLPVIIPLVCTSISIEATPASAIGGAGGLPPLVYLHNRLYDPGLGRFISADPATPPGNVGQNLYQYSNNNPATLTDVSGLNPLLPDGGGQNMPYQRPQELTDKIFELYRKSAAARAAINNANVTSKKVGEPIYTEKQHQLMRDFSDSAERYANELFIDSEIKMGNKEIPMDLQKNLDVDAAKNNYYNNLDKCLHECGNQILSNHNMNQTLVITPEATFKTKYNYQFTDNFFEKVLNTSKKNLYTEPPSNPFGQGSGNSPSNGNGNGNGAAGGKGGKVPPRPPTFGIGLAMPLSGLSQFDYPGTKSGMELIMERRRQIWLLQFHDAWEQRAEKLGDAPLSGGGRSNWPKAW